MEFDTARLTVRPWSPDHGTDVLARILTPAVLAPLPPALHDLDPDRWIAARLAESDVLSVTAGGAVIGIVLIAPVTPVHLGYLLAEEAWGQGYASELVQGLVRSLPGQEIRAGVSRDNPASARVLEKAGFTVMDNGAEMRMYRIMSP